ncbi:ATP-binding protein [Clostridium sp. MB40-C1]|uniref:HAMP domain-containing sensor histidine kinase n=1 Tax=Clostridium sp. MB40-C1 TaxID=3070996 RepID=UPI0027DF2650|nr:ATP-binding protein [Clostridium sp. MB40-C1]WMJ79264.1 ATP-binding protein [Clostridium sp. MB40-C1]
MKAKRSITKKLFVITTAIFTIFIVGTLIVQSLFFEKFYTYKKKHEAQSILKNFKQNYISAKDEESMINVLYNFEGEQNYTTFIVDDIGNLKFVGNSRNDRKEEMLQTKLGHEILMQFDNNNLLPYIRGSKEIQTYMLEKMSIKRKSVLAATYIPEKREYVFLVISLQPVNEAIEVIKEFYIYFFIGAVILIIILSLIYSNMITKPLIEINKTASKMAKLEFSEKCIVKTDDEIGNLAETLNFLSQNLYSSLTSLREANHKLEKDIDKERKVKKMTKEFIASVSHELKTPINIIEGYAEVLKDDIVKGEEKTSYLDIIIDESKKMASLVSDMLYLSSLESGNFKLTKEEFYIDDLIKTTSKKFSTILKEKEINLQMNLIDNIKVYADWNRIEQVITNYLTNAIRHTETDGSIQVNMIESEDDISVEVINTGSPIPEEELKNIWDKFYKIDKSRNRSLGGTGIGLAIVKNIIMLHEGNYGVENVDNGVKFYFTLKKNMRLLTLAK